MGSSDKAITIVSVVAILAFVYQIHIKNDMATKAIAAGLQECALHNPEQVVWQKECK